MILLSSADFFQNKLFVKIPPGILTECQSVWFLIRADKMSGLIWVQTVCKGYQQQTTKVASQGIKLSMHAQLYSGARYLIFSLSLHLQPYIMYVSSEDSDWCEP